MEKMLKTKTIIIQDIDPVRLPDAYGYGVILQYCIVPFNQYIWNQAEDPQVLLNSGERK